MRPQLRIAVIGSLLVASIGCGSIQREYRTFDGLTHRPLDGIQVSVTQRGHGAGWEFVDDRNVTRVGSTDSGGKIVVRAEVGQIIQFQSKGLKTVKILVDRKNAIFIEDGVYVRYREAGREPLPASGSVTVPMNVGVDENTRAADREYNETVELYAAIISIDPANLKMSDEEFLNEMNKGPMGQALLKCEMPEEFMLEALHRAQREASSKSGTGPRTTRP